MIRRLIFVALVLVLVGGWGSWLFGSTGTVPAAGAAPTPEAPYTIKDPNLFIYVPSNASQNQPLQVLVTMHGMGDNGQNFCQSMLAVAERNGWIIVAPTFKYHDYRNPDSVLQDDLAFLPRLATTLDTLPARTGLATRSKVLLFGFSRGGQAVHRFATLFPERVAGVAAVSSGSYTLPLDSMLVKGHPQTLSMPYGVANLGALTGQDFDFTTFKQIPFRISVGGADVNPNDTPRTWDPYLGTTRVGRATVYTQTLQNLGVNATLAVYPGVGHQVTPQMIEENAAFLKGILDTQAQRYGRGLVVSAVLYSTLVTASVKAGR